MTSSSVAGVRSGVRTSTRWRVRPRFGALDAIGVVWLVILLAFAVIPMLWMLSTSLKGQFEALSQPPQWIPAHPTLVQYQTLLSPTGTVGPVFLRYFFQQHPGVDHHYVARRAGGGTRGIRVFALSFSR
jgi:hypothetical protein